MLDEGWRMLEGQIPWPFLILFFFFSSIPAGLLRLQQIYQGLQPGNQTFQVETVKRISNASEAIEFLRVLENVDRWSRKYIVLDCSTDMAKEIIVNHVRDISLGRRTYHYLLSGLVSILFSIRHKLCAFYIPFSTHPFFYFLPSSFLFIARTPRRQQFL